VTTEFLNFSDALHHLRWGSKIARRSWPTGSYIHLNYDFRTVYAYPADSNCGPVLWHTAPSDIVAEDWYVVEE
jgi:hypothetical protein